MNTQLAASDTARGTAYRALKVIALTPHIRQYLETNDPKALEQVEHAIDELEREA